MENKKENVIKKIKKVLSIIGYSLLGLLVFIAIWLSVDKFIVKSKVPSFMGFATLRVVTGSMSGEFEEDDVIFIFKTNDYKIGNIVTYIQEGDKLPTTHRIVLYEGEGYITKGDANNTEDFDVVNKDEIVGEYLFSIPRLGLVLDWFATTEGIVYTIVFIVVLYGLVYLLRKKDDEFEEEVVVEVITDDNNQDKE